MADGVAAVVPRGRRSRARDLSLPGNDPVEGAVTPDDYLPAVERRVLCIGGRTELDRAASEMLAQVLGEHGTGVRVQPTTVSQDAIGQLDLNGTDVACISYLNPQPEVFARYVCRS